MILHKETIKHILYNNNYEKRLGAFSRGFCNLLKAAHAG